MGLQLSPMPMPTWLVVVSCLRFGRCRRYLHLRRLFPSAVRMHHYCRHRSASFWTSCSYLHTKAVDKTPRRTAHGQPGSSRAYSSLQQHTCSTRLATYKNEACGNFDATETRILMAAKKRKRSKAHAQERCRTAELPAWHRGSRKILIVLHHEIRSARNLAYPFLVPSHAC